MKKTFAGAALAMFTVAAHAQSSVMIYGILDQAVTYTNNTGTTNANGTVTPAGSKFALDSLSGTAGSRWGIRGDEDLGGGLHTIFTLESGINIPTGGFGQGGLMWGRQIFVGLRSAQYGQVTLGRQYDSVYNFTMALDAGSLNSNGASMHAGDLDNAAINLRENNSIRYLSPNIKGLTFGGGLALGGVAGDVTNGLQYNFGAQYDTGVGLKVGAAYEFFKNPTGSTSGTGWFTSNGSGTLLSHQLDAGYVSARSYQIAMVAAQYTKGAWTFAGSWSNAEFGNMTSFNGVAVKFNTFDLGVQYMWSPMFSTSVGWNYQTSAGVTRPDGTKVGNQHSNQFYGLAWYSLSKRTGLYAAVGYQDARGVNSQGGRAVADIDNIVDSATGKQVVARIGLRQSF
ncbi:porin [Burkholderia sp. IMCC1007]|uniref:porin n=1 Tax=Burkholderia sp. IMCC1007 TaxID=3004104 RepID=UPI0022B576FC|nr:porin [Burkholderia sp. IMCC1007]